MIKSSTTYLNTAVNTLVLDRNSLSHTLLKHMYFFLAIEIGLLQHKGRKLYFFVL